MALTADNAANKTQSGTVRKRVSLTQNGDIIPWAAVLVKAVVAANKRG